jgi:mono/diheme cytochrome c family protein
MAMFARTPGSIAALACMALASACWTSSAPLGDSGVDPYLADAGFRRATLVASLVNPDNGYSRLRLADYDTGRDGDWSRLPEWNPRVEVLATSAVDAPGGPDISEPLGSDARAVAIDDAAARGDEAALVALGADAFFRYPVQLEPAAGAAVASRAALARYGFWSDDTRGAGGIVRAELPDGSAALAYTCATCHAATRTGSLVLGVGNDELDLGRLAVDAAPATDPDLAARLLSWGPGRLDVTTRDATEPVRIPDLRAVRWLTHLQADATVAQRDRATLAIRIETLIVTSHGAAVRPPRAVALGLAAYVWSLASSLPTALPASDAERRGESLFRATCAGCHVPPALTGPPVPLDVVGTDPAIGLSPDRETGDYRVPSLHGVASRGALLHDASLPGLDAMFDPARMTPGYGGRRNGSGAVAGHAFGLDMPDADRAALLAYLHTL